MSALLRAFTASALAAACLLACSDIVPVPKNRPGWVDAGPPPDAREEDRFDTSTEMIAAFGDCMSYTDWVNHRMDQLPLQETEEGDTCSACHSDQGTGAYLNEDPVLTYQRHREVPSIYKIALPILDDANGEPLDVVQSDRYVDKGQEALEEDNGHPEYRLDPEIEDGLDGFFEVTYARFSSQPGACSPDDPL